MRNSFICFSFAAFLWLALTSVVNGITCNEWQSCESSTLSETGSTTIQCYGYQSCMNSSILVTGSASIECNGAYSCAQSIVQQDGSAYIRCYGFHSCSHSIVSSINNIYGRGASSLVNSNVTLTNGNLFCDGDRSCADSFIVGGEKYYMYGHLSGQNSIFQSGDSGVRYYFYGTRSGQNATILWVIFIFQIYQTYHKYIMIIKQDYKIVPKKLCKVLILIFAMIIKLVLVEN